MINSFHPFPLLVRADNGKPENLPFRHPYPSALKIDFTWVGCALAHLSGLNLFLGMSAWPASWLHECGVEPYWTRHTGERRNSQCMITFNFTTSSN